MKMSLKKNTLTLALAVFGICIQPVSPVAATAHTVTLKNHANALVYEPKGFDPQKKVPILMALHGMRESPLSALKGWKSVADAFGMLLVCPEGNSFASGFTRRPVDDRKNFVAFKKLLSKKYKVDHKKSVIAGFSRGGNFAIETGLQHPGEFRNIICLFGFYNKDIARKAIAKTGTKNYDKSSFYLISGHRDQTMGSLVYGRRTLGKHQIKSRLYLYKNTTHTYPSDLVAHFKKIVTWMDK
jgi:predicted esterase